MRRLGRGPRRRRRRRRRHGDLARLARPSSWPARRSPTRRRSAPSRRRAPPSTSRSRRRRSLFSSSARSTHAKARSSGSQVTDAQITKKIDEVKKQYFANDQKKFEQGLKDQGYTEATLRDDIRAQLVTEGIYDKVTKASRSPTPTSRSTTTEQGALHRRRVARRSTHPRQDEGRRRDTLHSQLTGRRELRGPREEVVARPRLEGPGRQAHRHPRADGRALRQGRLLLEDERALGADQDRVRLPPDPAARPTSSRVR